MIPFLLGIGCSLCVMVVGLLIFRSRLGNQRERSRPQPSSGTQAPKLAFSVTEEHAPRDLMNLESAIDLKKVLQGVAEIKKAEDARKG